MPQPEEDDPRPVVALPRQGLPGFVITAVAAAAALLLFLTLEARRRSVTVTNGTAAMQPAIVAPPPLQVPREPPPQPTILMPPARSPDILPPVPDAARQSTLITPLSTTMMSTFAPHSYAPDPPTRATPPSSEPGPVVARTGGNSALVIDGSSGGNAGPVSAIPGIPNAQGTISNRAGPGIGGDDSPARATFIGNHVTIMPVGTVIPAVLETPIDTARPGLVRAIVSSDTRGFDGRRVLVPRGSRLIGEYQADVRSGQDRVLVTWNRLIRPDGATIRLVSPTADTLGGAGVPGRVQTFFWQRFASALLQSALTVGVNLASRPGNGSVIVGLPSSNINSVVGQGLLPGNDLRPKIVVKQGAALTVFVARDLDFSSVTDAP